MLKKAILPLIIIMAGSLSIAMLVIAKPKPTPRPAPEASGNVKVAVVEALKQQVKLSVTAQGTVSPKREIDLIAQVSGQIVSVTPLFVDGGFFDASQVMIKIDDREYQVALLEADAKLAEAKRRLAEEQGLSHQAKRNWRDLGNQSANDLFIRKPQLAAAEASVLSASGEVSMAHLNLERTNISVPFQGRIKQTFADLGQFVSKGGRLATVYDSSIVEIRIPLTEQQAALVNLPFTNISNPETVADLPAVDVKGTVAGKETHWQGVLSRMDAFVDSKSRMYFAVVEVNNPYLTGDGGHAPLLPGLFVETVIEGKNMDEVIRLPRKALFERNKILAIDGDSKIIHREVNILRKSADQIWIQANIANNTLISIEKQSLTPEGTLVDPIRMNEKPQESISTASTTATPIEVLKD